jgi:hypothetical protein
MVEFLVPNEKNSILSTRSVHNLVHNIGPSPPQQRESKTSELNAHFLSRGGIENMSLLE